MRMNGTRGAGRAGRVQAGRGIVPGIVNPVDPNLPPFPIAGDFGAQRFQKGTGLSYLDVAWAFSGGPVENYQVLNAPAGTYMDGSVLVLDTDAMTTRDLTVRATNAQGRQYADLNIPFTAGVPTGMAVPLDYLAFIPGSEGQPRPVEQIASIMEGIRNMGVTYVRTDFEWVESMTRSDFNWKQQATICEEAAKVRLRVLLTWKGTAAWTGADWVNNLPQARIFARNAAVFFAELGVHDHELGNENNLDSFMDLAVPVATFTQWHNQTYDAIKAVHPNATVISTGLSAVTEPSDAPDFARASWPFLEGMYEAGFKDKKDAVGFHPYSYPNMPDSYEGYVGWNIMEGVIREVMEVDWDDAACPVWVTEMGSPTTQRANPTNDRFMTEQGQLDTFNMAWSRLSGHSWGGPLFWFTTDDYEADGSEDTEQFFGVRRFDGSEKPVLQSMRSIHRGWRGAPDVEFTAPVVDPNAAIARWRFQDTGTTFVDEVGGKAAQQGGTVAVAKKANGLNGKQTAVFVTDSYLRIPVEQLGNLHIGGGTGKCTVLAVMKSSIINQPQFIAGCWQEDNNDPKRSYGLFYNLDLYGGKQQINGHVSKSGGATPGYPYAREYSAGKRAKVSNEWFCGGFTYDGNEILSYQDGYADARPAYTDPLGNTYSKNPFIHPDGMNQTPCEFTIGSVKLTAGMSNFLRGELALLEVYDRALSSTEMWDRYKELMAEYSPISPIFDQRFTTNNTTTTARSPNDLNWQCYVGDTATDRTTNNNTTLGFTMTRLNDANHFLARDMQALSVAYQNDMPTVPNVQEIRWRMNTSGTQQAVRPIVMVDGQWYVSSNGFSMPEAGVSGTDWSKAIECVKPLVAAGQGWYPMTLIPGSQLVLHEQAIVQLPNRTIQKVGFNTHAGIREVIRLDNLQLIAA